MNEQGKSDVCVPLDVANARHCSCQDDSHREHPKPFFPYLFAALERCRKNAACFSGALESCAF